MHISTASILAGELLMWSVLAGAQSAEQSSSTAPCVSTSTVPCVSTAPVEGSTFDPSPRTLRGYLLSKDMNRRSLLLVQPNGEQIEMAVPADQRFDDLTLGTTLQVRYDPLKVEAIEIRESD